MKHETMPAPLTAFLALASILLPACDRGTSVRQVPEQPVATHGQSQTVAQVPVVPDTLAVERITSAAQFDAMAFSDKGGMVLGKSVKFFIDNREPKTPILRFVNASFEGPVKDSEAKQLHYAFAKEIFDIPEDVAEFNDNTYWTPVKRYYAGTIQQYRFGDDTEPTYAIQFYPQDNIHEHMIVLASRAVRGAFEVKAPLVFVATGQQQTTNDIAGALAAIDVKIMTLDEVFGTVDFIPMQTGEAWGTLRIFPKDQSMLSATDIPVFEELPLELTVVAGTLTKAVQDTSSHINLKSKERGTPNMVLRAAGPTNPTLAPFADKPVHLVVRTDGYTITPSTDEEVRKRLAERLDKPWQSLDIDPAAKIVSFDQMCAVDAANCLGHPERWGGKAANLGFLRHREVLGRVGDPDSQSGHAGHDLAPAGVGVPVQGYVDFVARNPELSAALTAFIAREKAGELSSADRTEAITRIQNLFMKGEFQPGFIEQIRAKTLEAMPGVGNLKVRSSANAEDIPGFDGAGLYDSFRVQLSEKDAPCERTIDPDDGEVHVRPRTLECVVKAVYASLWNKRAVEERSFARIDHASAAMGLAIVQRYVEQGEISGNAVVVTRVINSSGVFGYTVSSQEGNNVVTNPDPGTHSESIIIGFWPDSDSTFSVARYAKPKADGPTLTRTLLSRPKMTRLASIAQLVEQAYCRFKPDYYTDLAGCGYVIYDDDKPTSLDMEFKFYADGRIVCKQVREFSGR